MAEINAAALPNLQFTGYILHELQAPLASTLLIAQNLAEQLYGPLSGKQADALNDLINLVLKQRWTLNNILHFLNMQNAMLNIRPEMLRLDTLIYRAARLFIAEARIKGVEILIEMPKDSSLQYKGDPSYIDAILTNLISNAVKFTDEGMITIRAGKGAGKIWIEVRDTGIGIMEADHKKIFEPFMRLRTGPGIGIGLAIVKKFVEFHSGELCLQSKFLEGSTFTVKFPLDNP